MKHLMAKRTGLIKHRHTHSRSISKYLSTLWTHRRGNIQQEKTSRVFQKHRLYLQILV